MRGVRVPDGDGRFDVGLLAQRQHQAADQAHHARHLGDGDGDDDVLQAGLGQRHQRDGEQHARDRHQPVHDAHDDAVEPAHEAGDEADREADRASRTARRTGRPPATRGRRRPRGCRRRGPACRCRTSASPTAGAAGAPARSPADRRCRARGASSAISDQQQQHDAADDGGRVAAQGVLDAQSRSATGSARRLGDVSAITAISIGSADRRAVGQVDQQVDQHVDDREQQDHALDDRDSRAAGWHRR